MSFLIRTPVKTYGTDHNMTHELHCSACGEVKTIPADAVMLHHECDTDNAGVVKVVKL